MILFLPAGLLARASQDVWIGIYCYRHKLCYALHSEIQSVDGVILLRHRFASPLAAFG